MTCYRPVTAWKPDDGPIFFSEKPDCREIKISCGQCIGCRISKREEWTLRLMAESKMHEKSSFVTLTYDEDHVPADYSLNYRHFQLFMKRLRQRVGPLRFFVAGEYGDQFGRPHYHALLFGCNFDFDRVKSNSMYSAFDLYTSPCLESCWGQGFVSIGEVTYASARYTASYVVKRRTGVDSDEYYTRIVPSTGELVFLRPEFARMSLKPGIGEAWIKKFYPECVVHDGMVINGKLKRLPRYFDEKIGGIIGPDADSISYERSLKVNPNDSTRERLAAREAVAIAREKFLKESRV